MITDDFQPTFRVFVSSTFEDFRVERDVLRAGAFRDLEAYCAEHGCSFQAVDLRWGIDTEASIQQRTMRTCLDELKLCQMLSPRPNFLVLLGERYGWVPLPEEIPGDEMERLKLHLSPEWQGRVCDGIYKLDQNSLAPGGVYELQPRSGTYALDRASWAKEVEAPLRTVLFQAASKSGLTGAALAKYHASATEQEIMAGALSPDGAEEHVIFYERLVERSTPVDPSSPVERLKDKLRGRLGKRARDYKAGDLPASVTDPAMAAFNKAVKLDLMTIIQAEIARRKLLDTRHATEAAWLEALREGAESLAGRESECEVLVKACAVAEGGVHLVIGRPGIGKSALLWRVAHLLSEGGDGALLLGCRCGSRPSLFDTAGVFGALESQILQSQGKPPATFESGGIDKMLSFLQTVTPVSRERRVFVILDGADLLGQDADAVHLPMVLKALARQHIHVICAMRAGELATRMTEEAGNGSALNLGSLNRAVAKPLLERWLAERGRKTTPAQSEHVLRAFDGAGSPFWLRIATDIAATWEHDVTPEALPSEERDLLALLLRRLSSARGHGPVLTERTVETLAALQTGIPESDLMELLSADSAVMREFRERHPNSPATDSLAPIVWTRLRRDLEPLLERSQTHGALLLHFAHSQVQDVVRTKAGHAGTWITSRQALVSWLANARPVSAWALAEHDFLLEQLGEHARLARLLSEPCHLELRCRARQVGSVLLSLAKLGTTYPATDQWLQRLQRHSADLATGKLSIFTLLSIEAPSELASLREAHPNGLPGTGYFELNQLWSAQTISEGPVLEPTHTLPVAEPFHVITTATQPPSVFRYLGHGIVDHRGFAPGVQARSLRLQPVAPTRMAASGNGAHLAVILPDGDGELYDIACSEAGEVVHRFQSLNPAAEPPMLRWQGGNVFWQGAEGGLHWFDSASGAEHSLALPSAYALAEIAAVAQSSSDIAVLLRLGTSTALCRWTDGGEGQIVRSFEQEFATGFERFDAMCWAVAFNTPRLVLVNAAGSVIAETAMETVAHKLVTDGKRVLLLAHGDRLHIWEPGRQPQEVLPRKPVLEIEAMGNGNFVLQGHATAEIARIITRSRPEVSEERMYLFPQPGARGAYRAFRTRADDSGRIAGVDYVDALSRIVQPLGKFGSIRLSVASCGASFACINEGGRGFIYDSTMCGIMPIKGVPEVSGPAAIIGFEKHYEEFDTRAAMFVVACLDGSLWDLPFHGKAQSMGKVPLEHISRAVLLRHQSHLVWHGISIHHGKEGPEDTYSLMHLEFGRERCEFRGMHFTAEDGRMNTGVFDPVTGDLIFFWSGHSTLGNYIMRSPPEKLARGVTTREPLPQATGDIHTAHALPGTRLCVVEDVQGTATLIDLATLSVLGALPRSYRASSIAPASNGQFLLANQTGGLSLATWISHIPTP